MSTVNPATQCTLTNTFGITVQAVLAILVLIVLCAEYIHEYCFNYDNRRKLLQFWFDTYKICAGALISHLFNIGVSRVVGAGNNATNQCAVYAIAFYYEACGVPFVQLLQYGTIHYAVAMSEQPDQSVECASAWKSVSQPGLYLDTPSSGNDDDGVWECCVDLNLCMWQSALKVLAFAIVAGGLGFVLTGILLHADETVSAMFGLLLAVFAGTFFVAPPSSHWQVFNWIIVTIMVKTLWSIVAVAQGSYFRRWSVAMSTGNPQLDAWLFIAIIPIILNAFMFLMFSRISRLQIPCITVSRRGELDEIERRESLQDTNVTEFADKDTGDEEARFNTGEAIQVGIIYTLIINVVLFIIAIAYLESKFHSASTALVLIGTMIVFPVGLGGLFILIFRGLILSEPPIDLCCCLGMCVGGGSGGYVSVNRQEI